MARSDRRDVMPGRNMEQMIVLLRRLAQVLAAADEPRWSRSMSDFADRTAAASRGPERHAVVRDVLSLYGGMGSFNDVVLQDSQGVRPEQAELDNLRSRLFEAARAEL